MGRLTAVRGRLTPMRPKVAAATKRVEGFYQSPAWRALRSDRMLDADYFAAKARAMPGERLILDHKVERRDGGADLDPANTEWLTASEHNCKTASAKARRARGEVR